MRKLLALLPLVLVLFISSCGPQQTPTPAKEVLSPARIQEIESQIGDLDSGLQKVYARLKALEATIPRNEIKTGERWEEAVLLKEWGIPVSEWPQWETNPEDTRITPSPRYIEYARLRDEGIALSEAKRRLMEQLPPTPVRPTPNIQPILWKDQVVQIVQKYLRSLSEEEANDLGLAQEWELLRDDWSIRWKARFYPAGRRWEVECFEAYINVDDVSGEVTDVFPGPLGGNDRAHDGEEP